MGHFAETFAKRIFHWILAMIQKYPSARTIVLFIIQLIDRSPLLRLTSNKLFNSYWWYLKFKYRYPVIRQTIISEARKSLESKKQRVRQSTTITTQVEPPSLCDFGIDIQPTLHREVTKWRLGKRVDE